MSYATRDALSRSVGQLDRNYKYGGRSAYPMQKSTENVLKSPKCRAIRHEIEVKDSHGDVPQVHKELFLRVRSENMAKNHPKCCQIAKI